MGDSKKKPASPPPLEPPSPGTHRPLCPRCGSRETFELHGKVVCARCRQIIETCCGD